MVYCLQDSHIKREKEWVDYDTESENFKNEIEEKFEEVYEIVEVSELLQESFMNALFKVESYENAVELIREMKNLMSDIIYDHDS